MDKFPQDNMAGKMSVAGRPSGILTGAVAQGGFGITGTVGPYTLGGNIERPPGLSDILDTLSTQVDRAEVLANRLLNLNGRFFGEGSPVSNSEREDQRAGLIPAATALCGRLDVALIRIANSIDRLEGAL